MAYDEELAARVREALAASEAVTEKQMFGGIAFMLGGNMCCGVVKNDLMVRLGDERGKQALTRPHARPMDFTGRPMKGFIYVGPDGLRTGEALRAWVEEAVAFAASLPPK